MNDSEYGERDRINGCECMHACVSRRQGGIYYVRKRMDPQNESEIDLTTSSVLNAPDYVIPAAVLRLMDFFKNLVNYVTDLSD